MAIKMSQRSLGCLYSPAGLSREYPKRSFLCTLWGELLGRFRTVITPVRNFGCPVE